MIAFKHQNKDWRLASDLLCHCGSLEIRRFGLKNRLRHQVMRKGLKERIRIDAFARAISHSWGTMASHPSFFKYDTDAWKFHEQPTVVCGGRMKEAGVRIGFLDNRVHHLQLNRQME
jgi:hypothetical protein